jgi:hypothetical protein
MVPGQLQSQCVDCNELQQPASLIPQHLICALLATCSLSSFIHYAIVEKRE